MAEVLPSSEEHERELYERAHEATMEAEREGDAQLQAALAAAASKIFYPIATPIRSSRWSLNFYDRRLEAVYWRQCTSKNILSDNIPIVFQLVFQLWSMKSSTKDSNMSRMFEEAGHTTVAACCITFMTMQVLVSNWYQHYRGMLHCYFVIVLWIWESIKVLLHANIDYFHYATCHMVIQSIIVSLLYRVPFSLHMRVRSFGLCCQVLAAGILSSKDAILRLFIGIMLSHVLGSALAYLLDLQARSSFLMSLPTWLRDNSSPLEKNWSLFYPEFLEKEEPCAANFSSSGRRALGGFAGGFGGVSSLKCSVTTSLTGPVTLSSSSNSLHPVSDSASASSNGFYVQDNWSIEDEQSSASSYQYNYS